MSDKVMEMKWITGRYKRPVKLVIKGSRIEVHFKYNKKLIEEVKSMQGRKFHGFDDVNPRKIWSIANCNRNWFQIQRLAGQNPYGRYDRELVDFKPKRSLYDHQIEMVQHWLTVNYGIWACEMGTGKTLAAIEAMEAILGDYPDNSWDLCWYVGPKSGVVAVERELDKWKCTVTPLMLTYERLVKYVKEWEDGKKAPRVVVFDESSKIKTPKSQRSIAAMHLAEAVRDEWGDDGYVIEMSGTPAPKSPVDWWHQTEVACPGFLIEGNQHVFQRNLCIMEERKSPAGGTFPHIVTWKDDENKCDNCGQYKDHDNHKLDPMTLETKCPSYVKSVNEVERLYRRMQGLVVVKFKKDCLDLPDKQYEIINIMPNVETLRTAKLIKQRSPRTITALSLLRELSDGFQYQQQEDGFVTCPECKGNKTVVIPIPKEEVNELEPLEVNADDFEMKEVDCGNCGGVGEVRKYVRGMESVECPKDDELIRMLDEHEDTGRLIIWGGFTGTIDRITEICRTYGWTVLRVDGRGYTGFLPDGGIVDHTVLLDAMDNSNPNAKQLLVDHPKVVFVGHPKAGGMALTLTASPTMLFYSNGFDGEARMQAEDRFHRAGMDTNRGCRVIDLIHLPTDQLVLDNLKKKKKLQSISLGEIEAAIDKGAVRE